MSKLTRKVLEHCVKEAVQHMPILVGAGAKDWDIEVRSMAIDVLIDELAEHGIDVDEGLEEEELTEMLLRHGEA